MADTLHTSQRFTSAEIEHWRSEGAVLLDGFFTPEEMAPVHDDFVSLYGLDPKRPEGDAPRKRNGLFNVNQFLNIDNMPFDCSPALNMLGLHPALIECAKAALGVEDVYLYQSHSWAKYTDDTDYEQPFHCDYKNHTLIAPSDDVSQRTINFMIYCSDVTLDTGAISYVPQSVSNGITGEDRPMFLDGDPDAQAALKAAEQRAPGVAGSIFAYGIDVYHRGVNLTAPEGYRYTLTASFKAKGNDMIGYTAWPFHFMQPWYNVFNHASPDQLACIGVPRPGDSFWTERTLRRAQERWPDWDASAYRAAL